jgi:RNA polymerase sigma-70 factor (ECF subfamily)
LSGVLRKLGWVTVLAHETDDEFLLKAEPHRRELLAHCYRMLGSADDAEDLVQETYLRAWRAYGTFEGRSSLAARPAGVAVGLDLMAKFGLPTTHPGPQALTPP